MIVTILNKLWKRTSSKVLIRVCIYTILILILSILTYLTYVDYEKNIVSEQQQQMLGISRSISRSIELFTDDIVDSMKVITLDKEFIKNISYPEQSKKVDIYNSKLKQYFEAESKSIDKIYLIDRDGSVLAKYPQGNGSSDILKSEVDTAISIKKTYIGEAHWNETQKSFVFYMYEPIFDGNDFKGLISVSISLDGIYDRLIAPVKIGTKGYAMVKDQNGIIIMHPVKEQIGMNVINTRKEVFPNLEYSELESLIKDQLTGKEGTAIYHSYWWGDDVLKKVKKLNAYTPVKLSNHFWIIAITMSYDEIADPINKFLFKIIGIDILILAIIYIFTSTLIVMKKNKEELEKETEYLRMLNETSEQLRKKEAELYHSHKLKIIGTLAGGIAHDINNLLTPILGYSELLLMRMPINSEYREDIEEIMKASQNGKELIEQVLVFSRNDNEVTKVELVDINKVMKETLKLLKVVMPRNVIVNENIKKDCGFINANYTQIHQVIFNLCTNAYQAIKNNEGIIDISLGTIEGGKIGKTGDYIKIMVKDNGCGMDKEVKTRIFDPFFTTKEVGEGSGLGLFVVQSIISKYGGEITVESEPDAGSCFKVYLPLADRQESPEKSNSVQSISNSNKKILLVDDNEENIKMLRKGLKHLGYEVVTETNGIRALESFRKEYEKFDLVITDYLMPMLKGSELAAEIKKIKNDAVVILMTGYMDQYGKDNCSFIDSYISKPIEMAKLADLIKKY